MEFDRLLLLGLRNRADVGDPVGPWWLEEMARDLTALGSVGVLLLMTVGVLGYLLLARRQKAALFLLVAASGGWGMSVVLKALVARPRPTLVVPLVKVSSASFPSGHAFMAAVTYLTLAAMLARLHEPGRMRAYLFACAAVLTVLVGLTRVYLGVHWPTDVLAGWLAGAAWAWGGWTVAGRLQRQGRIEKPAA